MQNELIKYEIGNKNGKTISIIFFKNCTVGQKKKEKSSKIYGPLEIKTVFLKSKHRQN